MIQKYFRKFVAYLQSEKFHSRLRKSKDALLRLVTGKAFLYSVGSLLAFFVLMNYLVMPLYVRHGGTLTVPDVGSMNFDVAQKKLNDAGLVGIEGDKVLDNTKPIGTVMNQNPRPGAIVKYGRHVYLTVCSGELLVPVPTLRGRSLRDARFALERNGLQLGEIQYQTSEGSPANTIISQTFAPAEKVKKGMAVGVAVSSGREAGKTIDVPSLIGKSLREGEKMLNSVGLKIGNVTYQVNTELLPNTIVDQIPPAGTAADSGKVVDVFVIKAGKTHDEH